jgi:hypothetical protein
LRQKNSILAINFLHNILWFIKRYTTIYCVGMWALCPRHHIDLITFDLAIELHRRLAGRHPLAQWAGHVLNITRVQSQLLGDLTVREVEPHEIQAQYPNTQGLMRPFEDRTHQVIEIPLTASTMISLTVIFLAKRSQRRRTRSFVMV